MPHFTVRIHTDFGNPEFFFNRIFTISGVRYHVSVKDNARKSIFFTMEAKGEEWYIVDQSKAADWITAIESKLSKAIKENKPIDLS